MNVLVLGSFKEKLRNQLRSELANTHWSELQSVPDHLDNECPDLILCFAGKADYSHIMTILENLKSQPETESLISLVLFEKGTSTAVVTDFIGMGVDMVLVEPVPTEVFLSQIRAALKLVRLQSNIEHLNTELFQTSITDSLTRVLNRNGFTLRYDVQWRLSLRDDSPIALMAIDLDHFKRFNDHYGHVSADNCLVRIAQELEEVLQHVPHFVGRQGGEEFMILIPDADARKASAIAESIRVAIQELRLEHKLSPSGGYVTASLGVSACLPAETTMEKLLHTAERALRQAKRNGRNQICYLDAPKKIANVFYLDGCRPATASPPI